MTDEDIKKTYKLYIEERGFMRVEFFKDLVIKKENVRRAELVAEEVYNILDNDESREFKVLIDITKMPESHISKEANEIYRDVARRKQIVKVAVVGSSSVQARVLKFVMPFILGEGNKVLWFPNEKEAVAWLE